MFTQCSAIEVGTQQLVELQKHIVPSEWRNRGWGICALYAKSGMQRKVLYFDDHAVLTMQCDAQNYFLNVTGSRIESYTGFIRSYFF